MITEEDANLIRYFWEDKQNLEDWCDWELKREMLTGESPELIKAWDDYKVAIRTLSAIVRDIQQRW